MPKKILVHGDETLGRERFRNVRDVEIIGNEVMPPELNAYDVVVLSNLIQQARRLQVPKILELYRDSLVDGGQLIVSVPSLEWACTEIATNDEASMFTYISIFGDDENPYLSGFKLLWLRGIIERLGFHVQTAHTEQYNISVGEETHRVLQNVVVAVKRTINASEAIE